MLPQAGGGNDLTRRDGARAGTVGGQSFRWGLPWPRVLREGSAVLRAAGAG